MLQSHIKGSSVELNMQHVGTTENFQKYATELPDKTVVVLYIPRANFVHVSPSVGVNGRGQDLTAITMYQNRSNPRPEAMFLPDPTLESTPTKPRRKARKTR